MTATMTANAATKRTVAQRHPKAAMVSDRVIGVYFAAFPLVVAAFLSVQAVRAHGMETNATPAHHTTMAVAP